ncbi:hypothetical protein [Azospirillum griseum]|uniref:Uncharacterized protein n=1 Tax=Azospirillum griseum TaxID=2496639 RepID=A0A431VBY5_9PROT|nr:hypothetical protein [Azospirillum griseum]RTR16161.1 hypothetical protein EJ903_21440 [Azospirillum griseum]
MSIRVQAGVGNPVGATVTTATAGRTTATSAVLTTSLTVIGNAILSGGVNGPLIAVNALQGVASRSAAGGGALSGSLISAVAVGAMRGVTAASSAVGSAAAIAGRVTAANGSASSLSAVYGFGELPIELLTNGRHRLVYTLTATMRQIPRWKA